MPKIIFQPLMIANPAAPYGLTHLDSTPSHALKGQKLLAQGIALGNDGSKPVAL